MSLVIYRYTVFTLYFSAESLLHYKLHVTKLCIGELLRLLGLQFGVPGSCAVSTTRLCCLKGEHDDVPLLVLKKQTAMAVKGLSKLLPPRCCPECGL